jgi:glycopeptide antibiotics resistance protein
MVIATLRRIIAESRILFRILAFAVLVFIIVATLSSPSLRPGTGNVLLDRGASFASFGLLLVLGYPQALWRCAIVSLAVIVGLEIAQEMVPGRHGRIGDVITKSCGALFGVGLAALILSVLSFKRHQP